MAAFGRGSSNAWRRSCGQENVNGCPEIGAICRKLNRTNPPIEPIILDRINPPIHFSFTDITKAHNRAIIAKIRRISRLTLCIAE